MAHRYIPLHRHRLLLTAALLPGLVTLAAWIDHQDPAASPTAFMAGASRFTLPVARSAAPRSGKPVALVASLADTSAAGMAAVWADVRRRSYFLDPDAATPTQRVAANAAR
jgi:hypothetical protein